MAAQNVQYHAMTWWLWAFCAALTISTTESLPVVISVILSAAIIAKLLISEERNWKSFLVMVRVSVFILITRIIMQIALGVPVGNQIILRLPEVNLPSWFSGLRIGGIVTLESLIASVNDSLRLSGLIVVIATAVSLTVTSRVIQQLPVAFHEIGMVIIIAFTFLPHLFEDVQRIKQASRWRGQNTRGIKTLSHNLVSVSESALERSVGLAAALTVRGYGKATSNNSWRRFVYLGLAILTVEVVRLLIVSPNLLDAAIFTFALALIGHGIKQANRFSTRTKFKTETWSQNDFLVILTSLALVLSVIFSLQHLAITFTLILLGIAFSFSNRKVNLA